MNIDEARTLLLANGWSEQSLHIWIRAQGRCEYCLRSLLEFEDDHFFGYEYDHIVPDGSDGEQWANRALACKSCNRIKHRFADPTPGLTRAEKIARAGAYIAEIRLRNRIRLEQSREWLRYCGLPSRS